MKDFFLIFQDDSTEPVKVTHHFLHIEYEGELMEICVMETAHDINNSSYKFENADEAEWLADILGISMDELMDSCINTICKNGE